VNTQTRVPVIAYESRYFQDHVIKQRTASALHEGVSRYPIFRQHRMAARVELEAYFDAIALERSWRVERLHIEELIVDGDGILVAAYGTRKLEYCSVTFNLWAADVARANAMRERLDALAGATLITEPRFVIDWHFRSGTDTDSAEIEELANDALADVAYPEVPGGVHGFIERYLAAPETVLVLQGPPGTGKTRLIRAILGAMSARKGQPAQALYTGDMKVLENDEMFVKFITGYHDAFVVEDADHMLKPRADGNEHLHRFLTIADGVVRAQGRKIIFSTNLPNVGDLDEALIRPGRCYARLNVRALKPEEAQAVVRHMAGGCEHTLARGMEALAAKGARSHSLAEVYRCMK
jgi:hypothetical protein